MPNKKNIQTVELLREKIKKARSVILTDYLGLKAEDINSLRHQIKEEGAEMTVARNTLIKIALKEEGYDTKPIENDLEGPTAAVFSYNDPISPIKKLFDFAKELELPKVKSSFVEGKYNDTAQTEILSTLPSKEELIAKVVGGLKSPLSGFTNVLGGVQRNFVYAIKAIADKNTKEVSE
jgi:large subunit ribosomal protein L10